jgi:hypothetical protein
VLVASWKEITMSPRDLTRTVGLAIHQNDADFLTRAADRMNCSRSEVIRQCLPPSDAWRWILVGATAATKGQSLGDRLWHFAAQGLRIEMLEHGVEPSLLAPLTDDGLVQRYAEFREAVHAQAFGTDTGYRLEKPPAGGEWERTGRMGLHVLSRRERLTRDGVELIAPSTEGDR